MIALDTNVLIYAHHSQAPRHAATRALVSQLASSSVPWAIPWPCVYEFIKVVTHPRLFKTPTTLDDALAAIASLADAPAVVLLGDGPTHLNHLRRAAEDGQAIGSVIHDAHVVALCLEHGVTELLSCDRDFRRFRGLTIRDPFLPTTAAEPRGRYRTRGRRAAAP